MKKSFMTRVLATGLSLAMAFSLSAATNVSVASAAAKPAMKSKTMTVKVGQKKNYQATAATQKAYKITKVKMSAAGKTKAKVTVNSSKKSIKVEGLAATKGSNVVISFKNNKTKKTTTVTTKVVVKEEKQTITAVQSKVRAITVTSNKSMEGQEIKVTRGSTEVKFTSDLSSDGKTAVLKFESDLAVADYTVTVADMTATVKGELSKVDKIEIKSDVVAMDNKIGTSKKGFAGYTVTNQFEEDVTKKVSLTANSSADTVTAADGKLTFTFAKEPNLNDVVSVVLIYQSGAAGSVTTSKTLKVSNQSTPYTVEKYGVYNEDKKTLSATNALSDDFYYLFRVKDQYDGYMSAKDVIDAIKGTNGSQTMYVNSTFALTGLTINDNDPKKVTVDGVDYVGFLLMQDDDKDIAPGTGTIMLIPGGSGTTVTDTIEVATGSTVTDLVVTPPASVASGSTNYLDFKATDAEGNEVTDYNTLKKIQISNDKFTFVKKDGTTKLQLKDSTDGATNAGSVISVVFTLQNYKTVVVTVNVMESSILNGVVSLDSKQVTAAVSGDAVTIPVSKFNGEDQYGSVKAVKKDNFGLLGTTGGATKIENGKLYLMIVPDGSGDNFTTPTADVIYDADGKGQVTKSAIVLGANDSFVATGAGIGTESYTVRVVVGTSNSSKVTDYKTKISLVEKNVTASSSFTFTLTSTQASKYKSFEVEGPTAIYASTKSATEYTSGAIDNKYYGEVKAYGVVAGGARVQLKNNEFKITAGSNLALDAGTNKLTAKVDKDLITATNKTVKGTYTVTINATGEEFAKEVTVDTNGVKVASLAFIDGTKTDITLTSGAAISGGAIINAYLKGKDSYGVDLTGEGNQLKILASNDNVADKVNVVFKELSKATGSNASITKNGDIATNATITGYAGDSCTVVIKAGDTELFTTTISWN